MLEFELKTLFLCLVGSFALHLAQGFETVVDDGEIKTNSFRI